MSLATDLCIKLAMKNKDELRIPFRVLKDEIGRCEYTSEASIKEKQVDLLFKVRGGGGHTFAQRVRK